MTVPLCLFCAVWKEINRIAFENEELSIHRMKNYFVCNFWFWTKSIIDEGPLPLINFFDWLGSRWGLIIFRIPSFFVLAFWCLLYTPCMLQVSLKVPFIYIYIYIFSVRLLIKKKKKKEIIVTLIVKIKI